jgi:hypothetical protein
MDPEIRSAQPPKAHSLKQKKKGTPDPKNQPLFYQILDSAHSNFQNI